MNIRRAEEKDAERVLALLEQVNLVHHLIRPDLFKLATKYTRSELSVIFSSDETPVFVYEDEGEVLGYLFGVIIDHEESEMLVPYREFYIDDLCVDEAARGRGVATALYEYAKVCAKQAGCRSVTLNVWEGNDGARTFYDKMGMKPQKTKLETIL